MQLEFLLKMFPIATSSRIPAAYRSYPHASHNVIHRYCGMCDRKKEKTPEGAFSLTLTESLYICSWAETYL
jgi:hypothetical protein